MRSEPTKELEKQSGELIMWKWLGFDRFFPPDKDKWPAPLRGCASASVYISTVLLFNF